MVVAGSRQKALDPRFVLLGTRQKPFSPTTELSSSSVSSTFISVSINTRLAFKLLISTLTGFNCSSP
ncbi:unnamed protein product [Schistosoma margrebowiei]|uniref:Uncharacterized protein n=1 Tax=Schistosoma margrebowiei TaxID=48269 RepID=A0A183N5W5_9TREM|nr:unnamed protein product [Schistosoma margrebowiei]